MSNAPSRIPHPAVDERAFRTALSQFATGVTIITTQDEEGRLFGMTATSFNSVSLNPPLVLWSLGNTARSMPLFSATDRYVINVLAADQAALAERFASRIEDRFAGVDYDLSPAGLPRLRGCIAWFECHNRSRYPEGDHVIFVGEVEHCAVHANPPLVFHGGGFAHTVPAR